MRRVAGCAGVLAMCLAGCGSAEDAGLVLPTASGAEAAMSAPATESAASEESAVQPSPPAPQSPETPSMAERDPYGVGRALGGHMTDDYKTNPELERCAADTACPVHAEAFYFVELEKIRMDEGPIREHIEHADALYARADEFLDTFDILRDLDFSDDNLDQMMQVGDCIMSGTGCEGSLVEAQAARGEFDSYRAFMQQSEAREQEILEKIGQAKAAHQTAILDLAREASVQGSPSAHVTLADAYAVGDGVERSDALAVDHMIAAADAGSPIGQYKLAQMIAVGRAGPTHDVDALLRDSYSRGLTMAGHILLMRQRERGAVDAQLEAAMEADRAIFPAITERTIGMWKVHPEKPDTYPGSPGVEFAE